MIRSAVRLCRNLRHAPLLGVFIEKGRGEALRRFDLRDVEAEARVVGVGRFLRAARGVGPESDAPRGRHRPLRAASTQPPAVEQRRLAADVQPPDRERDRVEHHGGHERHEDQLHARRKSRADHDEEVDRCSEVRQAWHEPGRPQRCPRGLKASARLPLTRKTTSVMAMGTTISVWAQRLVVPPPGTGPPVNPCDRQRHQQRGNQRDDDGNRALRVQPFSGPRRRGGDLNRCRRLVEFQRRPRTLARALRRLIRPRAGTA